MKTSMKRILCAGLAAGMLVTTAGSALAGPRGWRGGHGHHRHHGGGNAALGAALFGIGALAIIGAASQSRRDRDAYYHDEYGPPPPPPGYYDRYGPPPPPGYYDGY